MLRKSLRLPEAIEYAVLCSLNHITRKELGFIDIFTLFPDAKEYLLNDLDGIVGVLNILSAEGE